jgi:predicted nuclease of predicted toxin-antitoxin system
VDEVVPVQLLIDQNLPPGLVRHLADLYPGSRHVRDFGLREGSDGAIWEVARRGSLILVTRDSDFSARSLASGHPPKVIWLRVGNRTKAAFEELLRSEVEQIKSFALDPTTGLLVLRRPAPGRSRSDVG